ncbi:MAG: stage V sporulation protein AD [Clostridia bacterium]|nr:stage V sporulation protein AD [Clostridia bacterium]
MAKRIGTRTILLEKPPKIIGYGSAVGHLEHEGPLGKEFDFYSNDCRFGEKSFEKAESRLQKTALEHAFRRAGVTPAEVDAVFAGDLLNQCIGSSFGLRELGIPFVGLYGACSTMTLALTMAALTIESGAAETTAAVTSSHFCSAERQYRFPLEYGCVRPQTAQHTVTGSGALILGSSDADKPKITAITVGEIKDFGVKDANNMGAAMAPGAADTLLHYFEDTGTAPDDYDVIYTGDLGAVGTELLYQLLDKDGVDLRCKHSDCGLIIYDRDRQDVHSGGSGCGCSASVLASFVLHRFESGDFHNILFLSTGALLSPTSTLQGESIPTVAHLIRICTD